VRQVGYLQEISYLFWVLLGSCRCNFQINLRLRPSTFFPICCSLIIEPIDYMNGLLTVSLNNIIKQIKLVMLRLMVQGVTALVHSGGGRGNLTF